MIANSTEPLYIKEPEVYVLYTPDLYQINSKQVRKRWIKCVSHLKPYAQKTSFYRYAISVEPFCI